MKVTKQISFEAAHRLEGWPNSKCYRLHGHSWRLEATFQKFMTAYDDCVVDYADLSSLLREAVFDKLDHQNINEVLEIKNPTSEVIVRWAFARILNGMGFRTDELYSGVDLVSVRLYETSTAWADYDGS